VFLVFWILIFLPVALALLARGFLYCSEFAVRRILEYEKGVIVGAGVLIGAVAGILKILNG
jgi:hypothetical protein